ncbi:MAG TPA: hypothetical protein VH092_07340 [Urbifossiella sp.]|jgi:hypothetical protein|nr:hypothetical protein [Urbifossiella sp.]
MTGRRWLNRRLGWFAAALVVGLGSIFAGILLDPPGGGQIPVGLLVGLGVGVGILIIAHKLLLRCPWCRGNLGPLVLGRPWFMGMDRRISFCPFCGTSLDEHLPDSRHPEAGGDEDF